MNRCQLSKELPSHSSCFLQGGQDASPIVHSVIVSLSLSVYSHTHARTCTHMHAHIRTCAELCLPISLTFPNWQFKMPTWQTEWAAVWQWENEQLNSSLFRTATSPFMMWSDNMLHKLVVFCCSTVTNFCSGNFSLVCHEVLQAMPA